MLGNSLRNRFVKRSVPGIEANLRRGGRADHKNRPDNEECKTAPSRGKPKGDEEFAELMNQAAYPFFNRFGIRQGLFPRFSFLDATSVGIYRPGRAERGSAAAPFRAHGLYRLACLIARPINPPAGKALVARAMGAATGAPASLGSSMTTSPNSVVKAGI